MQERLKDLADRVDAEVVGDPERMITGFASLSDAGPDDLSFFADARYRDLLDRTRAGAVLVPHDFNGGFDGNRIPVKDPYLAFVGLLGVLQDEVWHRPPGVHAQAAVDDSATVAPDASVGPFCVVERGATVGAGAVLSPGCIVGAGSHVGAGSYLHPNVTLRERVTLGERVIVHAGTVLGSDGFGYLTRDGRHEKIPHLGTVTIGDDVEIGANVAVDRGTVGETCIRAGAKIDNLVHLAHNVVIEEGALIAAQSGVSGSTTIGRFAALGGQTGVVGHIRIGEGARCAGQSGVTREVPDRATVSGYPAMQHKQALRLHVYYRRLPSLFDQIKQLENRIRELEENQETVR